MTPERLATLRFIARLRTVTIGNLADYKCISYAAAQRRLSRCKQDGLVRSEVDRTGTARPGHGSDPLIWSLTKKGSERLRYMLEHLAYEFPDFD
jgi:predicted ArsR family transcriptional regulator